MTDPREHTLKELAEDPQAFPDRLVSTDDLAFDYLPPMTRENAEELLRLAEEQQREQSDDSPPV